MTVKAIALFGTLCGLQCVGLAQDKFETFPEFRQEWNVNALKKLKNFNVLTIISDEELGKKYDRELKYQFKKEGIKPRMLGLDEDDGIDGGTTTLQLAVVLVDVNNPKAGFEATGRLIEHLKLPRNGFDVEADSWKFFDRYNVFRDALYAPTVKEGVEKLRAIVLQFIEDYQKANPK